MNLVTSTTTPIIFYYYERILSGMSPVIKYDVMICGDETIQATSGTQSYKYAQVIGGSGYLIDVNTLNSFLSATLSGATTSRCGVNGYKLTADNSGNTWA